MLDKMTYKNCVGETIEFGQGNYLINENDIRDYEWKYTEYFGKVRNFQKGITKKTLPVIIFGNTNRQVNELKNKLYSVIEKDVLAEKEGTLCIGEYKAKCYIYASKKTEYAINGNRCKMTLSLIFSDPSWTKEEWYSLPYEESEDNKEWLDYEYDYEYDYAGISNTKTIQNKSYAASDFVIRLHGPAVNPRIIINNHERSANVSLLKGERLEIRSKTRQVIVVKNNGEIENVYSKRSTRDYIFEKIPTGNLEISTGGNYDAELCLIDTRSEPLWI